MIIEMCCNHFQTLMFEMLPKVLVIGDAGDALFIGAAMVIA